MNKSTRLGRKPQPRPRPSRVVRVLSPIDDTGNGMVQLRCGRDVNDYGVSLFPAYGGEGLGVEYRKDDGESVYHVHVDEAGAAVCDCVGHEQHRHCKHADATLRLLELGKLRLPIAAVTLPLNRDFQLDAYEQFLYAEAC